jgi:cytochrome c2
MVRGRRTGRGDGNNRMDRRYVLILFLLAACAEPSSRTENPDTGTPGTVSADAGRVLFEQTCSRCHALPSPDDHPVPEWPSIVQRMRGNMDRRNVPGITDSQAAAIIGHLQDAAGR